MRKLTIIFLAEDLLEGNNVVNALVPSFALEGKDGRPATSSDWR